MLKAAIEGGRGCLVGQGHFDRVLFILVHWRTMLLCIFSSRRGTVFAAPGFHFRPSSTLFVVVKLSAF